MKMQVTHLEPHNSRRLRLSASLSAKPQAATKARPTRAFTLIELMISIALVLLLILGVNQVFTYTTQAVGAGEAINSAIRSSRAAQAQLAGDFSGIVPNGSGTNDAACIIISSRANYAFRDAKDQAAQGQITNPNSSTYPSAAFLDLAGSGIFGDINVNGDMVSPATYNFRNHRLDVLSFFARGLFPRQTGNPGTFADGMSSQEAWIWYGHLWLPDNSGIFQSVTFPTLGTNATNPNNYFGSKLVLGRMAMLLSEKALTTTTTASNYTWPANTIIDQAGYQQWFIDRNPGTAPTYADLTPLAYNSPLNDTAAITTSTDPGSTSNYPTSSPLWLSASRVDLASTSIANYRQKLTGSIPTTPYWWQYLMDGSNWRYQCNPFVAKPMTAQAMAQASPYFLGGCSQFIVEYAGDFLTQDNDPSHTNRNGHSKYGDVNGPGPDGQIDYIMTYPNGLNNKGFKQIAWYGMPRSTSGNNTICAANGDVVPLRDRFENMVSTTDGAVPLPAGYGNFPMTTTEAAAATAMGYPVFEQNGPAYQPSDYKANMTPAQAKTGYTCAFGPNDPAPKLIRITITLDDPTGRLPDGLTYQYVFSVPSP